MSQLPTQSRDHCSSLVRRQDEDRWLAAQYAKEPLQTALLALAALRIELRRIPSQVTEPQLGEIRLQWWREGLEAISRGGAPRAHPVLEIAAATSLADSRWSERLDAVIDASARPLYGEGFSSAEGLGEWLRESEGALDALAVEIAGGDKALADVAANAGAAFAMAREGRILAPKLGDEIEAYAAALFRKAAPTLSKAPPATAPALLHLALTPVYLRDGTRRAPLRKRMTLFSAMAFARF